jgi:hypothetical protein
MKGSPYVHCDGAWPGLGCAGLRWAALGWDGGDGKGGACVRGEFWRNFVEVDRGEGEGDVGPQALHANHTIHRHEAPGLES